MAVLIDADACPVVDLAVRLAARYDQPVTLVCDTSHWFSRFDVQVVTVDKGADSADFALLRRVRPGDIVVTQDYGLAAMCLAKRARVLNQSGFLYTDDNIDALLAARHASAQIRRGGGRVKGPRPRCAQEDRLFARAFLQLLSEGEKTDVE